MLRLAPDVTLLHYHYYIYIGIDHEKPQVPMITSHPQDVKIPNGHKVTLEVIAQGAMPLCYQWYFEDNIIPGMLNCVV